MTAPWKEWDKERPEIGECIVIVCDDGCSCSVAMMTESGPIDGEDGWLFDDRYTQGAIWFPLPKTYPLAFMERHDDY